MDGAEWIKHSCPGNLEKFNTNTLPNMLCVTESIYYNCSVSFVNVKRSFMPTFAPNENASVGAPCSSGIQAPDKTQLQLWS